jgi:hypothetical protein
MGKELLAAAGNARGSRALTNTQAPLGGRSYPEHNPNRREQKEAPIWRGGEAVRPRALALHGEDRELTLIALVTLVDSRHRFAGDAVRHNNRKNSPPPPPPNVIDAPRCTPKTSVSTPLHLLIPLSTRLDEISLPPAAHIGVVFGPFDPPWCPQRPSAAQPPRPNFLKGAAPAGHGWRPPRAGRPPLSRRPPLGSPSRAAAASREAIATRAPLFLLGGEESPRKATALCRANLSGLSSPMPPLPFSF